MHDFTVWVSYGKWRKNGDIRYCLLHLIHLSSTRLRRCGRILSGICEPYCLITPDLTMRYCPILISIDYKCVHLLIQYPNIAYWINTQPTPRQIIVQNIKNRAIYLKNNHPINIKYQAFKPTPTHTKKSIPFSDDPNPIKSLFSQPFQATMHEQLLTV